MTAKVAPFVIGSDAPSMTGPAGLRDEAMRAGTICAPWLCATASLLEPVVIDACPKALP